MPHHPTPPDAATNPQRPLLVVSNRLPVRVERQGDDWLVVPSAGGLATALRGLDEQPLWIGWPGAEIDAASRDAVRDRLREQGLAPVHLSADEERLYYRGFCNTALWPLFHYFTSSVSYDEQEWCAYVAVNERFAAVVADHAPPGARVWVHDFHLMLLPALLRKARPDLEIGFFLHIPFPSSEVYRLLPRREELLEGLLGADHLGFHTSDYARHFRATCVRVLGLDMEWDGIQLPGRRIGIGVHPIGIDTAHFAALAAQPRTVELYHEYRQRFGARRVVLGIERLDYTKGVGLKLEAFERFLAADPSRVETTALLQVLVPSRLDHPDYQILKSQIEETIGRINGTFGRPGLVPVHYLHRSLDPEELVALYRCAAVCLVTPVRDGMNLVAQEFVACQAAASPLPDCDGALVLSEFAGAAHTLGSALLVNPWHRDQVAEAIAAGLEMDHPERRHRILAMNRSVQAMDCNVWARGFCTALAKSAAGNAIAPRSQPLHGEGRATLRAAFHSGAGDPVDRTAGAAAQPHGAPRHRGPHRQRAAGPDPGEVARRSAAASLRRARRHLAQPRQPMGQRSRPAAGMDAAGEDHPRERQPRGPGLLRRGEILRARLALPDGGRRLRAVASPRTARPNRRRTRRGTDRHPRRPQGHRGARRGHPQGSLRGPRARGPDRPGNHRLHRRRPHRPRHVRRVAHGGLADPYRRRPRRRPLVARVARPGSRPVGRTGGQRAAPGDILNRRPAAPRAGLGEPLACALR